MRLTATDVAVGYGGRIVLDGVDLTVNAGESVAITGPSGWGKSTLLSVLGGLQSPQRGTVRVDPGDAEPADSVAWVLQTLNVLRDRSVVDNVRLGTLADRPEPAVAAERSRRALATVGLADRAEDPLRRLSGGEMQRAVVARCLASLRPFLLADEPTGQLDRANTRLVIEALVSGASAQGVVVVTHDDEVAARCSRVLTLVDGRLEAR